MKKKKKKAIKKKSFKKKKFSKKKRSKKIRSKTKKIKKPKKLARPKKSRIIKLKTKYKFKNKTSIKTNKIRVSSKTKQAILAIIRIQDKFKFNINFSLDKFLLGFFQSIANTIDNFKIILAEERERKKQQKIKLMEFEKIENIKKTK